MAKTNKTEAGSTSAAGETARMAEPTLQLLAEQTGVSVTTVSRVLSDQAARYRISKKTEEQVRRLAKEFNFAPNQLARSLRLKKTLTVGLVVPEISNPFFASIARQVTIGARADGYSVIVCDTEDNTELEKQSIRLLKSRNVEGILLCPVGQTSEHLQEFVDGRLPIVLVDRFFPELPLPYVISDNIAGAKQATELLITNGHRHIACLQGLEGTSPNESRIQGYKEALIEHFIPVDESLIVGDGFNEQSGYIQTKLLLSTRPEVRAILALSNLNALGAIRALAEERRRIPDDVSIISFDDSPSWPYLATPMTSVAQAYSEMGEVAVKLLFDQIRSQRIQNKRGILLPTTMVLRKSVKRLGPPTN